MLRTQEYKGRPAIVAFFDEEFEACDEADAAIVKVIFADGGNEFILPEQLDEEERELPNLEPEEEGPIVDMGDEADE